MYADLLFLFKSISWTYTHKSCCNRLKYPYFCTWKGKIVQKKLLKNWNNYFSLTLSINFFFSKWDNVYLPWFVIIPRTVKKHDPNELDSKSEATIFPSLLLSLDFQEDKSILELFDLNWFKLYFILKIITRSITVSEKI